jgi:hypothetical protein
VDGGRAAFGRTCRCPQAYPQHGDPDCAGEHGRERAQQRSIDRNAGIE